MQATSNPGPSWLGLALLLCVGCQSTESPSRHDVQDASDRAEARTSLGGDARYAKPGFHTQVVDGRLWVLRTGSEDLAEFLASGEPAKSVTLLGVGPDGMTVRSSDKDTIAAYDAARPGFFTEVVDGRLWVLREGSEDVAEFLRTGEPAKSVTKLGVGPGGMTVRSSDFETIQAYLDAR